MIKLDSVRYKVLIHQEALIKNYLLLDISRNIWHEVVNNVINDPVVSANHSVFAHVWGHAKGKIGFPVFTQFKI